jgi:pimeloyl-ACP methyl ester carboxylesterase
LIFAGAKCGKLRAETAQRITTSPQNAVRMRNTFDDIDMVELLPKVQVPPLVLHCRHDNVAPFEQDAGSPARFRAPNS